MKYETIVNGFALATPLIGLATAWLGYKAAAAKHKPLSENAPLRAKRLRVLSFSDPTIRSRPWNIRRMKWISYALSIVYLLVVVWLFEDSVITYVCAGIVVFNIGIFALFRDKPPSRTLKTANLVIKGNREQVLQDCLTALTSIGAEVAQFDSANGVIDAGVQGWTRSGALIRIEATNSPPNGVSVRIMSDALSPAALIDFGSNARNIRRIKAHLI